MNSYYDPNYVDYDSEEEKRQIEEDRRMAKLQEEYMTAKLAVIKETPLCFNEWCIQNRSDINFLWDQLRRVRLDLFSKISMYTFTKYAWKFSDTVALRKSKVTKDDIKAVGKSKQNIHLVRVPGTVDDYYEWKQYNKDCLYRMYQQLTGYSSNLFCSLSYEEFCLMGWKYSD